jgi:hypothetical protein
VTTPWCPASTCRRSSRLIERDLGVLLDFSSGRFSHWLVFNRTDGLVESGRRMALGAWFSACVTRVTGCELTSSRHQLPFHASSPVDIAPLGLTIRQATGPLQERAIVWPTVYDFQGLGTKVGCWLRDGGNMRLRGTSRQGRCHVPTGWSQELIISAASSCSRVEAYQTRPESQGSVSWSERRTSVCCQADWFRDRRPGRA